MYRINKLLKLNRALVHTDDLALLWGMTNKNTLYTTIARYVKKGILIQIHKGFYSTIHLDQLNPIELAIAYLHRFAYLSCESILVGEGIIFQKENYITLVSDVSRKFVLAGKSFLVRQMRDEFLYNDIGIINTGGIRQANLERAVADILYFNPRYYFDNKKKINFTKVKEIQKAAGFL